VPHVEQNEQNLDTLVDEIFDLTKIIYAARSRRPSGPDDLSETEFLALDLLNKHKSMTIGEIQRSVGVVPAQMSRIVRSLETQGGRGYVECSINSRDRRRVNVMLTSSGKKAYETSRSARLSSMYQILEFFSDAERADFMRLMRRIRDRFSPKDKPKNKRQ